MARRKSRLKLPFFKMKVNKQTIFNIIGFALVGTGIVLLLSYIKSFSSEESGKILYRINQLLLGKFGTLSFFVPLIAILLSGHFFNTKKLKFIKPNITGGLLLIFVSLIGIFQSGSIGKAVFDNLTLDFSLFGTIVILSLLFIIGLILFLDTSVDVFLVFLLKLIVSFFKFIKEYVWRGNSDELGEKSHKEGGKAEFIKDKKTEEKLTLLPVASSVKPSQAKAEGAPVATNSEFSIKPLAASTNTTWVYPPLSLLSDVERQHADRGDVKKNADTIEKTLDSFGLRARVAEVNYGPTVTQYALEIAMGTKLSKITALSNNLALTLAASTGQVRIEAPIPGRALVGIEIPNKKPEIVTVKRLLSSPLFTENTDPLLVPLGLDVSGKPQAASIGKMPHVLVAGTTGSGKSVLLNAWISTLLFRTKPETLRMILVDPKRVELSLYNGIPHLLTEVIVDKDKIISALKWTVSEMETRYKDFASKGVRNLEGYNELEGVEKKPYIMFVIDELADLMIFAPGDAEDLITRIAQMARATGIHLLLATQRPSVDVITGLMKANIPTRAAFNVSSMIDSRVIIDMPGAEKLLGKGDMLFLPPDQAKPRRIQSPYITEKDVTQLVKFLKTQVPVVHYTEEITTQDTSVAGGASILVGGNGGDKDPLFNKAVEIMAQFDKASASLLQRRLAIGYARAARLLDQLEAAGYVGPSGGSKPREILKRSSETQEQT